MMPKDNETDCCWDVNGGEPKGLEFFLGMMDEKAHLAVDCKEQEGSVPSHLSNEETVTGVAEVEELATTTKTTAMQPFHNLAAQPSTSKKAQGNFVQRCQREEPDLIYSQDSSTSTDHGDRPLVSFDDTATQVHLVENYASTIENHSILWFSKDEYDDIEARDSNSLSNYIYINHGQCEDSSKDDSNFTIRGLEKDIPDSEVLERRRESLKIVFQEQERQRHVGLQQHLPDYVRVLREMTTRSAREARQRGQKDALVVSSAASAAATTANSSIR